MNAWETIFRQSRVNNGYYDESKLPQLKWDWPKGTWFQARLDHTREHHPIKEGQSRQKFWPERGNGQSVTL